MQGTSRSDRELLDAAALCRQLVPEGSVYAFLADHRVELFPVDAFADLFPSGRGRPSVPGDVIASAIILKELEGLSDRQAADAVRCDIRWKGAYSLALDDEGVHYTVFTYWRQRLARSERLHRIGEAGAKVITATGVLNGKRRRALDSTLLDDAVTTQDTVTQLVSAIRRVRRVLPVAGVVLVGAHDYDAGGKPVCAWDDPDAKQALVTGLVNDALAILAALDGHVLDGVQADAVGMLALVAGQDVEPGEGEGSWRIAQHVAPDRTISTVNPQPRHMHKSVSQYRDWFKAHIAIEPETGIITASALTAANVADGPTGITLLDGEEAGLQVLADSAYGSGQVRSELRNAGHEQAIKPMPLARNPKLGVDQFNRDDFTVTHTARTVTCPAGQTVTIAARGGATFGVRCNSCALRTRCTSAKGGKTILVRPGDAELVAARKAWREGEFTDDYRPWWPMVERSISWLVGTRHLRVRCRGIERNYASLKVRVAAINLRRIINLGLDHEAGIWVITS